jgi:DNA-binding IclR family transcriptional regulator
LGKRCLAVPVFGGARQLLAAISVSGSCFEVRPENAAELVKVLSAAATQIHRAFGGNAS